MTLRLAIHGGTPLRTRPFARWPEWGDEERRALARVLESGSWGGHPSPGAEAHAFAEAFRAYLGVPHVVPCTSGSTALVLALQASRLSPGAEVVTTAYSFVATAGAIAQVGCLPVPVDVEESSYCLDPTAVEAALTDRSEAILAVHLACSMADLDRLGGIARRRGLVLIEDCAHAHGARWRGRAAGSLGDFGCFSMQSTKLLTAGEGGAVATGSAEAAARLRSLVDCGRKEPGRDAFPERLLGHNYRISEFQAAILREQLQRLDEQHERRARAVARLEQAIADVPGIALLAADPRVTRRTHYQTLLRYDASGFAGVPRDHVLLALQAEGLPCHGRFYVPIDEDPLFARDAKTNPAVAMGFAWGGDRFPVARRAAYEATIWLPHELFLGPDADVDDIAAILARVQAGAAALRDQPPKGRPAR